jgi:hypothetical protein
MHNQKSRCHCLDHSAALRPDASGSKQINVKRSGGKGRHLGSQSTSRFDQKGVVVSEQGG